MAKVEQPVIFGQLSAGELALEVSLQLGEIECVGSNKYGMKQFQLTAVGLERFGEALRKANKWPTDRIVDDPKGPAA